MRVRAITLCIVCVFIGDLFFDTNGTEADTLEPALAAAKLDGLGVVIGSDREGFKEAAVLAIDCVLFHGVCFIVFKICSCSDAAPRCYLIIVIIIDIVTSSSLVAIIEHKLLF